MEFHVLTLFPDMIKESFQWGVLARARESGGIRVEAYDIRSHTTNVHRTVDDYPYGGGDGMVMKPEPLFFALEAVKKQDVDGPVILLSPQGETFTHEMAGEFAEQDDMVLLCGRYEGVDERVIQTCIDREVSIGDYVLTGGELAAMVIIDSVARLVEGVLGNVASARGDSFEDGLLKYPHYTRPASFRGMKVPEVLLSGNHGKVARWRRKEALRRTLRRRPDLLAQAALSSDDQRLLEEIREEFPPAGNG